ncbi:hypothetical protein GQ600_6609 [Phytophthora cactorum]|nr:hypothetical protein GQ600_6609 [Phytophthora cactorum]
MCFVELLFLGGCACMVSAACRRKCTFTETKHQTQRITYPRHFKYTQPKQSFRQPVNAAAKRREHVSKEEFKTAEKARNVMHALIELYAAA